jgi:peptide/nickel transport system substrate-binding protein
VVRRVPLNLALLAAVATAVTGCTTEQGCVGDWCGTVVVASPAEAGTLLPPVSQSDVARSVVDLVFLKLADIGPDLNLVDTAAFVPELASSWAFEDSLTLVFRLREDVRWHDGAPVTAADVAFTYDVYRDTLVGSPARPRLGQIRSVTARDEYTVAFDFERPYPEQLFDAVYHMFVLPRHLLDTVPRAELPSHPFGRMPVGAGPYRFVRWTAGQSIELSGDSTHVLGRPGLPRVIWRFSGGDYEAALTQLTAGEADLLSYLSTEAQERVAATPELVAVPYRPSTSYSYLAFNFRDPEDPSRPHPLFASRELRRALTLGIDREAVIRAVDGPAGRVAPGPVTPAYWIAGDAPEQLPFDSARARAELESIGWRDSDGDGVRERAGRTLTFDLLVPVTSTPRRRSAVIVQEQLGRLGIEVRIEELDFNTFLERIGNGAFDVAFGAYGGDPSPAAIAEVWTGDAIGGFNAGHYVNPTFDRAVAAALDARALDAARAHWREALEMIVADAPAIWMSASGPQAGVHGRLAGVTIRGDNVTATLPAWTVPPDRMIERDRLRN